VEVARAALAGPRRCVLETIPAGLPRRASAGW
jgi:hypothetical protein